MFDSDVLIDQLGGLLFLSAIHAIDLEKGEDYVSFLLPANIEMKNHIKIIYDFGMDLYAMEFYDCEDGNLVERIEDVYFDMLQDILIEVVSIPKIDAKRPQQHIKG